MSTANLAENVAQSKPAKERKPYQKRSLIAKLAEACNAVGGVDKKGRNEHQKYNYVRAADIAKAIRHELFKRGLILFADEKEISHEDRATNGGGTIRQLTIKIEYTVRDSESDEFVTTTAYGIAMDTGDKAIWKAKTGALKYYLRTLGIIPDERDDPEADEKVDEYTDPRVTDPPESKNVRKKIAEFQVRAFDSACNDTGKTAQQKADFLKVKYRIATVADLTREQFDQAIKWAVATEPLEDSLSLSVQHAKAARKSAQPAVRLTEQPYDDEVAIGD